MAEDTINIAVQAKTTIANDIKGAYLFTLDVPMAGEDWPEFLCYAIAML